MKVRTRGGILAVLAVLLGLAPIEAQNRPEQKPQLAEEVFKNVQVLKGMTANEFIETMGFFSASTLLNCADCHTKESSGDWAKYADDTDLKRTARRMVLMVNGINKSYFGGRKLMTCYTCHRGDERPKFIPNLTEMYSAPPQQEPEQVIEQNPNGPSPASLLAKYIQAIGGAQKVGGMTSLVAKGIYEGSPVSLITGKSAVEIYVKSPDQRTMIVHADAGDTTNATDGRSAWYALPTPYSPISELSLTGADLDAVNMEATLTFPARISQVVTGWRVGYPVTIDNVDTEVIQGTTPGKLPVKLYFDPKSGLLVRSVRYTSLAIGLNPFQADYSDYREVSGVKIPFRIKTTSVAGQATITLSEVQLNVPIDAAKFGKPAPPVTPKTTGR